MTLVQRFRQRRARRKVRQAKSCLKWIDSRLARLGCPTWKRQQMRRDIVVSDKALVDYLDILVGEKR